MFPEIQHREREGGRERDRGGEGGGGQFSGSKRCITHKILVVIICEEVLETAGPVGAAPQQTEPTLLTTHVAVPRVLFDGCVRRSLTNEEVDTLNTETPEHRECSLVQVTIIGMVVAFLL